MVMHWDLQWDVSEVCFRQNSNQNYYCCRLPYQDCLRNQQSHHCFRFAIKENILNGFKKNGNIILKFLTWLFGLSQLILNLVTRGLEAKILRVSLSNAGCSGGVS